MTVGEVGGMFRIALQPDHGSQGDPVRLFGESQLKEAFLDERHEALAAVWRFQKEVCLGQHRQAYTERSTDQVDLLRRLEVVLVVGIAEPNQRAGIDEVSDHRLAICRRMYADSARRSSRGGRGS